MFALLPKFIHKHSQKLLHINRVQFIQRHANSVQNYANVLVLYPFVRTSVCNVEIPSRIYRSDCFESNYTDN